MPTHTLTHTSPHTQALRRCFAQEPNGYMCPEVISMWSSVTHERGAAAVYPHLRPALGTLLTVAKSDTVGSVVALLVLGSLVRCSAMKRE